MVLGLSKAWISLPLGSELSYINKKLHLKGDNKNNISNRKLYFKLTTIRVQIQIHLIRC